MRKGHGFELPGWRRGRRHLLSPRGTVGEWAGLAVDVLASQPRHKAIGVIVCLNAFGRWACLMYCHAHHGLPLSCVTRLLLSVAQKWCLVVGGAAETWNLWSVSEGRARATNQRHEPATRTGATNRRAFRHSLRSGSYGGYRQMGGSLDPLPRASHASVEVIFIKAGDLHELDRVKNTNASPVQRHGSGKAKFFENAVDVNSRHAQCIGQHKLR